MMQTRVRELLKAFLVWLAAVATFAEADERSVYMVRVPMPIQGDVDARVRGSVERIVEKGSGSRERPILVLEFWPTSEEDAAASSFERSLALARYLTSPELARVRTVAYLPRGAVGHAVLPVIACEQIIMHPDAELGDASRVDDNPSVMVRSAYRDIASRNRTVPEAMALGMLDPSLTVMKLTTASGSRFALQDEINDIRAKTIVTAMDTVVEAGNPGVFQGRDLRLAYGIVSHLASSRSELAEVIEVTLGDLEPDPSVGTNWNAMRVDLRGPINDQSVQRIQRPIEDEVYRGERNLICLVIDSPGGSLEASLRLAGYLAELNSSQVRTVAVIEKEALADAALVATACDHVIMLEGAKIGGPGAYQPKDAELTDARVTIQQICRDKNRRWSLPLALIDPTLVVSSYTLEAGNVVEYLSPEELAQQADPARWQRGDQIKAVGRPLSLNAAKAKELGLARYQVASFAEFKQLYGLENDPELIEPNWADEFIADLAQPHVTFTLLFFAGMALMVELSSPGTGAGGFVAAVCFVLFFWSKYLHGTASWLEILLFVTGLCFVLMEIFVLPGFGVFGLGGGGLIVASLILASQTFIIPRNAYQMEQLPYSLLTIAAAGGGIAVGLVFFRRFMETAPVFRRIMLPEREPEQASQREAMVNYEHLLGKSGVTMTRLMPGGKVRVGREIVQVVTDGFAVDSGQQVEVVEVMGNRVVVRPVNEV